MIEFFKCGVSAGEARAKSFPWWSVSTVPVVGYHFLVPVLCMCVGELSPGWILSQPRVPWVEEACVAYGEVPGSRVGRGPRLILGILTK